VKGKGGKVNGKCQLCGNPGPVKEKGLPSPVPYYRKGKVPKNLKNTIFVCEETSPCAERVKALFWL